MKHKVLLPKDMPGAVRPSEGYLVVDMLNMHITQSDNSQHTATQSCRALQAHNVEHGHQSDYRAIHRDDCEIIGKWGQGLN